jgi:hypothetical protein
MFTTALSSGPRRSARAFVWALAIGALFASEASAQAQLFQHCDFGGWSASFTTTGNFNTAAIVARGGINNDASSIRVSPGFRVTLFSGNNQTGTSVVVTADDDCFVNENLNDVVSSLRIEAIGGGNNVVQLFQHCDFSGWQANFPAGSFNTAAITARGGVDNDASSIRVSPGFRVRLFDGDGLTGNVVDVAAGDTPCFVGLGFNDALSSLQVLSDGNPTPTPTPTPPGGGCTPDAPAMFSDDYVAEHTERMTRVFCNSDIAVYFDDDLRNLPAGGTSWVAPFLTDVWRHYKDNYGSCSVPRNLPAPIGPGCERFGQEQLFAFFHQNKHFGGTVANRFDEFSGFRNTIDAGDNGWSVNNATLRDVITHEACHIVEGASQGVHESPAFGEIWGDSKWAEICQYDFYQRTGRTADATRVFNQFMAGRDNLPSGANGAAWFRDWFHPLWVESGRNVAFMDRFFGLLSRDFPKRPENNNRNQIYTRRMNAGEFVHFMSGAVGRDLSNMAAQAFNSGFSRAQFEQAQRDFPNIQY